MANDPGRDLIPVKDVGIDKFGGLSCRSKEREYNPMPIIEGSYASKLDRTELENRYLRFLEENINLKKHCHNQEEKIKRLAAKLLRVVAERNLQNKGSSTTKYSELEVEDLMSRVNELERTNQLLKEKLVVAGIQLSTHHGFVPRSAHKSPHRFGCHPTPNMSSRSDYCRDHGSENLPGNQASERINMARSTDQQKNKYAFLEQEVCKLQKQLINYEKELETVREQSNTRVQVLEDELARVQEEGSRMASALSAATAAAHSSVRNLEQSSRRVAENVEIIRLQRHIKTQEEHVCILEDERREAMEGIQKMNELMDSLQRENCELKELLSDESIKVCKLQNEVEKALKESTMKQLALEELQEEINDLKVEKSIIQDANNKIVMSIMDKIIDDAQESAPVRSQVRGIEKESVENSQPPSKSPAEDNHKDNSNVHTKNGMRDCNRKMEEDDILCKEKDIERRVMELEEELNKRLATEREVQMLRSQEQQKEKEHVLKLKELEMQQALNMAENENLKKQVDQKEDLLNKCNLKVDRLEEELKTLRFQFKEMECTNLRMSEKLTSKDVEIQGLQEVQKELTKQMESQLLEEIQGDSEEEDKQLSVSSSNEEKHEAEDINKESNVEKEEDVISDSINLKLTEVSEQYEKAQELIQEKEATINVYKLEVDKLSCDLDSLKSQNESLLSELKQKEEQNKILSMKEKSQSPLQPVRKLSVDPGKCIFEIHMDCIMVSDEGVAILKKIGEDSSSPTPSIFITWEFFEQEAAYSPLFQGPDAQLNCSYDHLIPITPGLFEYLDEETLRVEIHAAVEDMSIPVAQGIISFQECLNYPQRMISQSTCLISLSNDYYDSERDKRNSVKGSTESTMEGQEFGILQYRFKMNCHKKCVDFYKRKKMKEKLNMEPIQDNFREAPPMKDDIGKYAKKCIEKTKKEPLRSTSVDKYEGLEEDNMESEDIISPPKPAPRSLKKSSLNDRSQAHEDNVSRLSAPQITIEIHSLRLVPKCSVSRDPNVHQLFIEYSFLGKGGENLETPVSLPKPQSNEKLCFNFKRVFPMDSVDNIMERNILRNMIHMKGNKRNKSSLLAEGKVRFNVVSEPLSDDDSNAECIDIGYADVNIPNILLDGQDIVEDDICVLNSNGTNEVIGFLNISFLAYDVLLTLCGHPGLCDT